MGIETAFNQMVILFFGIILGFVAVKAKVLDGAGCKVITSLVMNITLPCFIIASGLTTSQSVTGSQMFFYFVLSLVCYALAYLVGLILSRLPLFKKKDRRLCSFMTTFGNTGFMGLPLIGGLFGSEALFYATIFNLPFNFLVFSIGIYLVSADTGNTKLNPRMFFNPCLIASLIAIALYLLSVNVPDLAKSCLETAGSATVPLAMIITGASLAKESPKDVFTSPGLYVLTIAKILLVPIISFAVLSFFLVDPVLIKVGTVLMAMPVATNSTLLCLQYGGNDRLASRGVFLSTLLAIASIPALVFLIGG